ncbi:MAG: molybdopterin molybdotransferase MoeA [Firmicutes bacterium]|nr:molybdopterin molybdotransferase MoeA [Bacillota bacterium]
MSGFRELYDLITVDDAINKLIAAASPVQDQVELPLLEVLGRVTSGDITSEEDIPGFPRSTVDGYAVRAKDTFGSSQSIPGLLTVMGKVGMGEVNNLSLKPGEAVEVPTGGMLPEGADSVVMVEYVERTGDLLQVYQGVSPGENMVAPDEDLAQGEVIVAQGHRIRPQDMGALAACGISRIPVYRRLKVGLLSTGDEIVPIETRPLAPGQIRDVNSYALAGHLVRLGCETEFGGIILDDFDRLVAAVEQLVQSCDLVLLSGGSSVGMRDHTVDVIERMGPPGLLFHGVTIKPGKPTLAGMAGKVPIIGLPGHPASALVVYKVLVEPLVRYLQGEKNYLTRRFIRLPITRSLSSPAGREEYVRVRIEEQEGKFWAQPVLGKSGMVSTLLKGQAIAVIPLGSEGVKAGELVEILPWDEGGLR